MALSSSESLDRRGIEALDASDQLTDILAIPEHLRDALWKVESAQIEPQDCPGGVVVAGMGVFGAGVMIVFFKETLRKTYRRGTPPGAT